jgi:diguanylate cyclase (GGDEF)-like protein
MNPLLYLLVSLEFTSLMLMLVFFIAWLKLGRRGHALAWSLAFLVAAVQWVLNIGQSVFFSNHGVYWMVVSATSIITMSLGLVGYRQRAGLANPLWAYLAAGVLVESAIGWVTFVQPHAGLRTAIGPLYASVLAALCMAKLVARDRPTVAAEWGSFLVLGAFALCETAAAVAALPGTESGLRWYKAINFLSLPSVYIGTGLFMVLNIASDMSEEMKSLALRDPLTGLLNRRGFQEASERQLAEARRRGTAVSVIVTDVDRFKAINDGHGHAAGDEALRRFADCLRSVDRERHVIGRIGGEEFALLLPDTPAPAAIDLAEQLRTSLTTVEIDTGKATIGMRASFGVTALDAGDTGIEALLSRADAALYRSKQLGRDRVTLAERETALA